MKVTHNFTDRNIELFWEKVNIPTNRKKCWEWTACKTFGYGRFTIRYSPTRKKLFQAHRVSYELHNNGIPSGLLVLHECNNPSCVNPGHLYAGTQQNNMDDMIRADHHLRGERNPIAKLTEKKVLEIREKYIPFTYPLRRLAREFNVSKKLILLVIQRKIWTHI